MSKIEITVPDQLSSEIDRMVDQGEFLSRDQAIEELLTRGVSAYDIEEEPTDELDTELFTQAVEEQQDPASQMDQDGGDEYTF